MRPRAECYVCLIERAFRQMKELTDAPEERIVSVLKRVSEMLVKEFGPHTTPAWLGTLREVIIQRELRVGDYFKRIKEESDRVARSVLSEIAIPRGEFTYKAFRKLALLATAANAIEFHIRGHEFSIERLKEFLLEAEKHLRIDEIRDLWEEIRRADVILYGLDNHGEAVFDLQLVRFLHDMGKQVIVAARGIPVLNDVTVEEAVELGFSNYAKVISNGDWIGMDIRRGGPEEFLKAIEESDVIVAKGMGNYESLSGGPCLKPTFVMLKAKCRPVAEDLGVSQGDIVVKRLC